MVKKGSAAPGSTDNALFSSAVPVALIAQGHSSDIGWMSPVVDSKAVGTTGKAKALEALRLCLVGAPEGCGVRVSAHVENIGWQAWSSNGSLAGTTGRSLTIEAVKAELTGPISSTYDLYYRVHVANIGWLGWTKNGVEGGTSNLGYRMEGYEVVLKPKGSAAPGSTANSYLKEHNDTVLGVSRPSILRWLNSHRYDGYYLGTRYDESQFKQAQCIYPNGAPRWDGYTAMNCTGFVAHTFRSVGFNIDKVGAIAQGGSGRYVNAYKWYYYARQTGAKMYGFRTVNEMLASGIARKGDLIFFMPDNYWCDCHIGFFWGDTSSQNLMWHSTDIGNIISNIYNFDNKAGVRQTVYIIR